MNFVVEAAIRVLFPIVAELVISFVINVVFGATYHFFLRTGDFLIELITLDYFRDHSKVPVHKKTLNPVPGWISAVLGAGFWYAFGLAAYTSWPWLSEW